MTNRYVEKYSPNNPIMTAEVLLELAQSHKLATLKRSVKYDLGTHDQIKVSSEDIEIMGDTLKFTVFYIPAIAYRQAVELARDRGVLIDCPDWLSS